VNPKVVMLWVELVIVSVTVTVTAMKLVAVTDRLRVVIVTPPPLDGTKATPMARARRQTAINVSASCPFMNRVQPSTEFYSDCVARIKPTQSHVNLPIQYAQMNDAG